MYQFNLTDFSILLLFWLGPLPLIVRTRERTYEQANEHVSETLNERMNERISYWNRDDKWKWRLTTNGIVQIAYQTQMTRASASKFSQCDYRLLICLKRCEMLHIKYLKIVGISNDFSCCCFLRFAHFSLDSFYFHEYIFFFLWTESTRKSSKFRHIIWDTWKKKRPSILNVPSSQKSINKKAKIILLFPFKIFILMSIVS